MTDALARLLGERAVAIVRSSELTAAVALEIVETLLAEGLGAVEFTLDSRGALEAIAAAAERFGGDAVIGAGTVVTPEEVSRVADAGARFVVSPGFDEQVVAAARAAGLVAVPGAFTATEVQRAVEAGAGLVKLFPATGGPAYLAALRGPFPDVPFVPTGGVGLDDIAAFLRVGASAVGLGSALVPARAPLDGLAGRAAAVRRALEAARS